jgi:hypothetical protein
MSSSVLIAGKPAARMRMRAPEASRANTSASSSVSRKPLTTVSGVRSSCETLATKSRRIASRRSAWVTSRDMMIERAGSKSITRIDSATAGLASGRNSSGSSKDVEGT